MSYAIGFYTKVVQDSSDVLAILDAIRTDEDNQNNIKDMVITKLPFALKNFKACKNLKLVEPCIQQTKSAEYNLVSGSAASLVETFIQALFTKRFCYWKTYNLLGYMTLDENIPKYVQKHFDKKYIYFQNSCDQNYDYRDWSCLGPFADQIIKDVTKLTLPEVASALKLTIEEVNEMIEDTRSDATEGYEEYAELEVVTYYKRILVYKRIETALGISAILDHRSVPEILQFESTKSFTLDNYKNVYYILNLLNQELKQEELI